MTNRFIKMWLANVVVIALFALVFVGCSSAQKAIKSGNIEQAYDMAMDYYKQEKWSKAYSIFESVSVYYIGTQREDSILYYTGRARFKAEEYEIAIALFEDYRRTYGRSTLLEDVEGMYTLSHYYLSPGPTRDQSMTELAITKIDEFCSRYPYSRNYANFIEIRKELVGRLYEKDYNNSYTYYKVGRYKSAIASLRNSLKRYPQTTYREDIVYHILAASYELAENSVPSRQFERYLSTIDSYYTFIAEFPESKKYGSSAEKIFASSKKFVDRGEAAIEHEKMINGELMDEGMDRGGERGGLGERGGI